MATATQHSQRYVDYLKSAQWKLKRSHALFAAHGRCVHCRKVPPTEVHHVTYERLGNERPSDLVALCHECHEKADEVRRRQTDLRRWEARVNAWASRKYGEDWEYSYDFEYVELEFGEWLEWH